VLLSTPLALHDVANVENFARAALEQRLRNFGAHLSADKYEDALSELISVAWELSLRYDPARSDQSFSTYAGRILRFRVADWFRGRFGDARYGPRPPVDSLDELLLLGEGVADGLNGLEDVLSEINVAALSPESRRVLTRIARPIVEEGETMEEIATRLGCSRREIARRLHRLRDELQAIAAEPPPEQGGWLAEADVLVTHATDNGFVVEVVPA
jgi:RNA polymerase sigma factor (sigma-70 family)